MKKFRNLVLEYKPQSNQSNWDKIQDDLVKLNSESINDGKLLKNISASTRLFSLLISLVVLGLILGETFLEKTPNILTTDQLKGRNHMQPDSINSEVQNSTTQPSKEIKNHSIIEGLITKIENSKYANPSNFSKQSYALPKTHSNTTNSFLEVESNKFVDKFNDDLSGYRYSEKSTLDFESGYNLSTTKFESSEIVENSQMFGNDSHNILTSKLGNIDKIIDLSSANSELSVNQMDMTSIVKPLNLVSNKQLNSLMSNAFTLVPSISSPNKHFFEVGASFGYSQNFFYRGQYSNIMLAYKLNKFMRIGARINFQKYSDKSKFITDPNIRNYDVYTHIAGNIGLTVLRYRRFSLSIDGSIGVTLVSENRRVQDGPNFKYELHQFHGANGMLGANLDYEINHRWKLGFESIFDLRAESNMHGVRIKYSF